MMGMSPRALTLLAIFIVTTCAACEAPHEQDREARRVAVREAGARLAGPLVRLKTRDRLVSVVQSAGELLFDIEDAAGRVVATGLSRQRLEAEHPDLHEVVESATATTIDASYRKVDGPAVVESADLDRAPTR